MHSIHNVRMARPILHYTEKQVYDIIKKYNWKLHKAYNYSKRLGCIYCFAKTREEWDELRNGDPEVFLKALEYVTDGLLSDNITEEIGFNTIRKMMVKKPSERAKRNQVSMLNKTIPELQSLIKTSNITDASFISQISKSIKMF